MLVKKKMTNSIKNRVVEGFGQRLQELMIDRGLNQFRFAEIIKVSSSYVSKMVNHDIYPREQTTIMICNQLGTVRHWLDTGEGPKYESGHINGVGDVKSDYKTPPGPVERALDGIKEIYSQGDPYLIQAVEAAIYLARKSIRQDRLLDIFKNEDKKIPDEQEPLARGIKKQKAG